MPSKPQKDSPDRVDAYTCGQDDFLTGKPLRKKFGDQHRQELFERGYMFEKSDWETRPRSPFEWENTP